MNLLDRAAAIRGQYNHCFGCGINNPIGLQLTGFERSDNVVRAAFDPRLDYHGFSDLLHGGIIATALDEIMAWTAVLVADVMVMTGKLDLRYRKPAKVESSFVLEGELLEQSGRRLRISATMSDGSLVVAQAAGLFLTIADLGEADRASAAEGKE